MAAIQRRRGSAARNDAVLVRGAGETHRGHVRSENQDVLIVAPRLGLYAVLDGMGVLNELKGMRPDKKPRIIILSGYGSIRIAVKTTRLGAMAFLEKPVVADDVRAQFPEP